MERNRSILIADDNIENVRVLTSILKEEGYKVRIAMNGEQAVNSVMEKLPDLIILDIQMPKLDGYEACRRIKMHSPSKEIPIIFISAMDEAYNKVMAFEVGGVDYIAKPFYAEEVIARVNNHIQLFEYQQQLRDISFDLLNQFQSTFEQAAVGIVHIDPNTHRFLKWNAKFKSMLCHTDDELVKIGFRELIDDAFIEVENYKFQELLSMTRDSYISEFTISCKEHGNKWMRITFSLVVNARGENDYVVAIVEDISKRIEAEQEVIKLNSELEDRVMRRTKELSEEKAFVNKIINNLPGVFHAFTLDGKVKRWNKYYQNLVGLDDEDLLDFQAIDIFPEHESEKVTKAIRKVFAEGSASVEAHIISKDGKEIPFLMTGSHLVTEEDEYLVGLGTDISERKAMEQELLEAKEKAEVATKAKSDFLATMSHEIRTPMNAIIGLSHLALKTKLDMKSYDYVSKINRAGQNLLQIINDILDFSKVEAGKLKLETIAFDLNDVLGNMINIISMKAQEKDLELVIDVDSEVPRKLIGDPLRLGQILLNLTNNAVKFTDKGNIIIKLEVNYVVDDVVNLRFSVIDTGIGLKPEKKDNLFESFSQADTSTTRKYGGTGLGLAICKQLVKMMNGDIHVASTYGVGSNFSFTCDFGMTQVTSIYDKDSKVLEDLDILVVDDNDAVREVIYNYLTGYGFNVTLAESGETAMKMLENRMHGNDRPWRVVLVDWIMDGMDGFDFIREYKAFAPEAASKIIMMTNYAKEDVIGKTVDFELDGFLTKPITQSVLYDTLLSIFQEQSAKSHLMHDGYRMRMNAQKGVGKKILLAEDNDMNQQISTELLEQEGYEVFVVNNGLAAYEHLLEKDGYDCILMDLQMPIMKGFEATEIIENDANIRNIPIIAMTADASPGIVEKVKRFGMRDYITKPVNPQILYSIIDMDREEDIAKGTHQDAKYIVLPFEYLEGIDIDKGLHHLNGNTGLYLKLLRSFYHKNDDFIERLQMSIDDKDIAVTERMLHTMKGLAGNLGATRLQKKTEVMESLVTGHRLDEMTTACMELEGLVKGIRKVIEPYLSSENLEQVNRSIGSKEQFDVLIQKLAAALKKRKITQCRKILEELDMFEWSYNLKTVKLEVETYLSSYKFKEAIAVINQLREGQFER